MQSKINKLMKRLDELEELLGAVDILSDQKKFKQLSQEHAYLANVRDTHQECEKAKIALAETEEMLKIETDPEFVAMLQLEIPTLTQKIAKTSKELEQLLIPPDPRDNRPIIMEIRAGTGGDEAAIFVGDCVRMYKNYASKKLWGVELLSCTESELGGFKEYILSIAGPNVFRLMQYEAGTHRVQRVPATESQGRVHTSAITVAIILEPDEQEKIELDEKDLKIDTYRASGAGGQHVNTTDSAVRITHIPTGTVVYCQEERSQHKNKDKAMRLLKAKIADTKRAAQEKEISSLRSSQIGSGDRSERIRTYNFPQNRLTDHRIDLTLYKLDQVMDGDLEELTEALVAYFYQQKINESPS